MSHNPLDHPRIDYVMGEGQPDIPPQRMSHQPPNLNLTVPGHGRSCEGGQNIGEGDDGSSDSAGEAAAHGRNDGVHAEFEFADDASIGAERSVNGDEGPEDHLIEVGDLGMVPIRTVMRSLARHGRCTCHSGVIPSADDYPFSLTSSRNNSGIFSQHSMTVEVGSSPPSMSSSCVSFGHYSSSSASLPGVFDFLTGGACDEDIAFFPLPFNFIRPPIWLSPTLECQTHYPPDLSESDFEDS